jgi:hypothetical protein
MFRTIRNCYLNTENPLVGGSIPSSPPLTQRANLLTVCNAFRVGIEIFYLSAVLFISLKALFIS